METFTVHTITKTGCIKAPQRANSAKEACIQADRMYNGVSIITKTGELTGATLISLLNLRAILNRKRRHNGKGRFTKNK